MITSLHAQNPTVTDWQSYSSSTATGVLIGITITSVVQPGAGHVGIATGQFSTPGGWNSSVPYPLPSSTEGLNIQALNGGDAHTFSFSAPLSNLLLYIDNFDSSSAATITASGATGIALYASSSDISFAVQSANSGFLSTTYGGFDGRSDAIIAFSGPVTSVHLSYTNGIQNNGVGYTFVIRPNVSALANSVLNPKGTYLRTVSDPNAVDPTIVPLAIAGIFPGDYLFIERSGRFGFAPPPAPEEGGELLAVFSSNSTVSPNPSSTGTASRVPGAILSAATPRTTINTFHPQPDGRPTDIPEDFDASRIIVQVPAGAQYLMLCGHDEFYGDNVDGPPRDFQASIVRIRDPDFDTDNDGSSDLSEFLAGTDYSDPNSRLICSIGLSSIPGQLHFQFTAQPYRFYDIERSHDLSSWGYVESVPLYAVPTQIERDYAIGPINTFYRVKVTGMMPE